MALTAESGEPLLADWLDGVPTGAVGPYPPPVVPPRDWAPLRRGVNLAHWYTFSGRNDFSFDDLCVIRRAGFDFVRFPVEAGWCESTPPRGFGLDLADPTGTPQGLAGVLAAVDRIISAGLACLLDFHSYGFSAENYAWDPEYWRDPDLPHRPNQDLEGQARPAQDVLVAFWTRVAAACAHYPQHVLAYEWCNEPGFWAYKYNFCALRDRIVAAIRTVDPHHLIVSTFPTGGVKAGMWKVPQVGDRGTAYAVHNYDPLWLTTGMSDYMSPEWPGNWFSGCRWPPSAMRPGRETWHALRRAPGVSDADWAAKLAAIGYPQAGHDIIARYCAGQEQTPDSLLAAYRSTANWCWCPYLRVLITEFGVVRYNRASTYTWTGSGWDVGIGEGDPIAVDERYRSALLHDHRRAIEAAGMGWAVWDYIDWFGVARRHQGWGIRFVPFNLWALIDPAPADHPRPAPWAPDTDPALAQPEPVALAAAGAGRERERETRPSMAPGVSLSAQGRAAPDARDPVELAGTVTSAGTHNDHHWS